MGLIIPLKALFGSKMENCITKFSSKIKSEFQSDNPSAESFYWSPRGVGVTESELGNARLCILLSIFLVNWRLFASVRPGAYIYSGWLGTCVRRCSLYFHNYMVWACVRVYVHTVTQKHMWKGSVTVAGTQDGLTHTQFVHLHLTKELEQYFITVFHRFFIISIEIGAN